MQPRTKWTKAEEAWGKKHRAWELASEEGSDDWMAQCIAESVMRDDGWAADMVKLCDSEAGYLMQVLSSKRLEGIKSPRVLNWIVFFAGQILEEEGAISCDGAWVSDPRD